MRGPRTAPVLNIAPPGQPDLLAYTKSAHVGPPAPATGTAGPAASTAPVISEAEVVSKAALVDSSAVLATVAHKLTAIVTDYLVDTRKDADKKVCEAIAAVTMPDVMMHALVLIVRQVLNDDMNSGNRRRVAHLLNVLRAGKKPVCSLDHVLQALQNVCEATPAEQAPLLRSVIDDACKDKTNPMTLESLSAPLRAFMEEGPTSTALAEEAAAAAHAAQQAELDAAEAAERAVAAAAAAAAAPPVAAGTAAPSSAAPAAAAAAAAAAPKGDLHELVSDLLASGEKGVHLAEAGRAELAGFPARLAAAAVMTGVAKHVQAEGKLSVKADWLAADMYGALLAAFCNRKMDASIAALYAFQAVMVDANFPKGVMPGSFLKMYEEEIMEEEAFIAWKEDVATPAPGKQKALIQTTQFFTFLQEAEEEDETDSEVEDALKDVVRPNNSNKLR